MTRILVVEDDAAVARGLVDNLRFEGFSVDLARTAEQGLERLHRGGVQLVLLDLMLPGMSGFDLLRRLPEVATMPRVVVVSARDSEADVVRALDLGAHDYVKKPFGLAELLARVRAQIRDLEATARDDAPPPDDVELGDVRLSLRRFRVWKGTRESLLSHTEVRILQLFLERPDQPLRRAEILDAAWEPGSYPTERTVDNFVLKLRKKLEDDPSHPRLLETVHGVGYRFKPPA